jgi:hypothetical protein
MKIIIKLTMDNAAFEDEGEMKRILNKMVDGMDDIIRPGDKGTLRDFNGNKVGKYEVKP